MARQINEQDRVRMLEYADSKIAHGVDYLELESAKHDATALIPFTRLRDKIANASLKDLNTWFKVKDNSVHFRKLDFLNGRIGAKQLIGNAEIKYGERVGNWRDGERQKASDADGGRLNSNNPNHWFDYSFIDVFGIRRRVEIKHSEGWFEPNRNGR